MAAVGEKLDSQWRLLKMRMPATPSSWSIPTGRLRPITGELKLNINRINQIMQRLCPFRSVLGWNSAKSIVGCSFDSAAVAHDQTNYGPAQHSASNLEAVDMNIILTAIRIKRLAQISSDEMGTWTQDIKLFLFNMACSRFMHGPPL